MNACTQPEIVPVLSGTKVDRAIYEDMLRSVSPIGPQDQVMRIVTAPSVGVLHAVLAGHNPSFVARCIDRTSFEVRAIAIFGALAYLEGRVLHLTLADFGVCRVEAASGRLHPIDIARTALTAASTMSWRVLKRALAIAIAPQYIQFISEHDHELIQFHQMMEFHRQRAFATFVASAGTYPNGD